MSDQSTALPDSPEAEALFKQAHDDAIAALAPAHDAALARLDDLRTKLLASFDKAKEDAGHVPAAGAFVRDVELKGAEIVAWIARHL